MLSKSISHLLRLIACLFVLLSLNTHSASVTTQVQLISYVSRYYEPYCDLEPTSCHPYMNDYSNDDLFFTFTAIWDDATSSLNLSILDDNTNLSAQFTDGYQYYEDDPDSGYYFESETASINVTDGQIISFQATYNNSDSVSDSDDARSWVYDGNQLIRNNYHNDNIMYYSIEDIFTYNVISPSEVPLPAGIYLFLSGLVGLGLMRGRNG